MLASKVSFTLARPPIIGWSTASLFFLSGDVVSVDRLDGISLSERRVRCLLKESTFDSGFDFTAARAAGELLSIFFLYCFRASTPALGPLEFSF